MKLLMRTLRRVTSLEESLTAFARLNFGSRADGQAYDTTLSVYEIDDDRAQITQAQAEHRASFACPPTSQESSLTLHGFPEVDICATLGDTAFGFTRRQHREMRFFDEAEVLAVAEAVRSQLAERQLFTTVEAMWDYVLQRLQEQDPEWMTRCASEKRWRKWTKSFPGQVMIPDL
jgi:hypothetical protein